VGELSFDVHRWKNDKMNKLYNDDALWAYVIWVSEEMHHQDWDQVRDPVLHRLLSMGVYDWSGVDKQLNQTVPAMRHSTTMASRLLQHLLEIDEQVGCYWPYLLE